MRVETFKELGNCAQHNSYLESRAIQNPMLAFAAGSRAGIGWSGKLWAMRYQFAVQF